MFKRVEPQGDAQMAAEKLRRFEEFADNPDPLVMEFAHYLGNRISPAMTTLDPLGFLSGAVQAAIDLRVGMNGFSGELIDNQLVGLDPERYDLLIAETPKMARIAFSEEFSNAVERELRKISR